MDALLCSRYFSGFRVVRFAIGFRTLDSLYSGLEHLFEKQALIILVQQREPWFDVGFFIFTNQNSCKDSFLSSPVASYF